MENEEVVGEIEPEVIPMLFTVDGHWYVAPSIDVAMEGAKKRFGSAAYAEAGTAYPCPGDNVCVCSELKEGVEPPIVVWNSSHAELLKAAATLPV